MMELLTFGNPEKAKKKKRKDGGKIRNLPVRMEEGQASPCKDNGRSDTSL